MKTSKLQNIAWVFFALILTSATVFAQGWREGNRSDYNKNVGCLSQISGLTETQQSQIAKMEDQHQSEMDELRIKRRSTINAVESSEIRTEMLKKVEAHRKSVKSVLTADQQKQYDQLHTYGNYGRNQQFARGNGGNGRGNFACGNAGRGNSGNAAFRGRGGNFQNSRGNGAWSNCRNNFSGRNAGYGRGAGRARYQDTCVRQSTQDINDEGFEKIE
ncbi:Spy/CpxP family protein refolding chaperone [Prolixibacteraceae bacterium Z1-6]|uniref:Spy/CpxP family protein refolding chaperone n=1 Tax=Draconibacterium aestuarii TaxID=2998507 RepID=A0A9X3J8I3_9BACT|nr:Spy/CpxP family protein refolding chaperone [Prolixibacteraceae bacterium Z1-6]